MRIGRKLPVLIELCDRSLFHRVSADCRLGAMCPGCIAISLLRSAWHTTEAASNVLNRLELSRVDVFVAALGRALDQQQKDFVSTDVLISWASHRRGS